MHTCERTHTSAGAPVRVRARVREARRSGLDGPMPPDTETGLDAIAKEKPADGWRSRW